MLYYIPWYFDAASAMMMSSYRQPLVRGYCAEIATWWWSRLRVDTMVLISFTIHYPSYFVAHRYLFLSHFQRTRGKRRPMNDKLLRIEADGILLIVTRQCATKWRVSLSKTPPQIFWCTTKLSLLSASARLRNFVAAFKWSPRLPERGKSPLVLRRLLLLHFAIVNEIDVIIGAGVISSQVGAFGQFDYDGQEALDMSRY